VESVLRQGKHHEVYEEHEVGNKPGGLFSPLFVTFVLFVVNSFHLRFFV